MCLQFALFIPSTQALTLQGHVYNGNVGDETQPLSGVTVTLYGSNNSGQMGTAITSTTTNSRGWYGLEVAGAWVTNWIQYDSLGLQNTTTGNKF